MIPQLDGAADDDSETDKDSCISNQINKFQHENCTSLLLTNARLLFPKTDALMDAFDSLELNITCVTETWFKPWSDLRARLADIEGEHGVKILHKSRDGRFRKSTGGVAVAFRTGRCNLRKRELRSRKSVTHLIWSTRMKLGVVLRPRYCPH